MKERDVGIDFLKLLSCIAVIGLHTLGEIGLLCGFAIPVFWLCSGYLLLQSDHVAPRKTAVRILRVLGIVAAWTIIWLSFPRFFVLSPGWEKPFPLCLLKYFLLSFQQVGIWQFWYFGSLILVYIFVQFRSAALRYCNIQNEQKLLITIWSLFLVFSLALQICSFFVHLPVQSGVKQTFRLWTWLQYFLMGAILYRKRTVLFGKLPLKIHAALSVILFALSFLAQWTEGHYLIHELHAEYFYDDIVIICWVFMVSSLCLRLDLTRVKKPITVLSKLTMGVYIIHPFLLEFALRVFPVRSIWDHLAYFFAIGVTSFTITWCFQRIPVIRKLVSF